MLIGFTYALIQNTRSKNQHYRDKKISFGSLKNLMRTKSHITSPC